MKSTMKTFMLALVLVLFVASLAAACAPAAAPAAEEPAAEAPAAEEPAAEEMAAEEPAPVELAAAAPAGEEAMGAVEFVTWYQYDQNNLDPASDERVGNQYLAKTIPEFNAEHEGAYIWKNVPKAWDKIPSEIVTAVIAGGDVPDLVEVSSSDLPSYWNNGAVQELSEWAEAQAWWADMDPAAIEACTMPDGGLYCIPMVNRPHLVYVWADRYPDGFPTTPEAFIADAERLKAEGAFAMTMFFNTGYDGGGATRAVWAFIDSWGGTYSDAEGNMLLNTPENIAAIEFLRMMALEGYIPEIAFAGSWQEEEAFKDSSAGAFPTGLFGYRYVNPLTAPDGTKYETGTSQDMLDAIADGQVILRPMFAPEGNPPGCQSAINGFIVPVGAQNMEGGFSYINWLMEDADNNAEYVLGPGAGFPTLLSTLDHELYQEPFYEQARIAIEGSNCTEYIGTLQNPSEARVLVMNAVYKLVKENPTADIAAELQAVQDEYNANNN